MTDHTQTDRTVLESNLKKLGISSIFFYMCCLYVYLNVCRVNS